MAKDKSGTPSIPQKGKMTVIMFQLEGSDDTLQDAIKVLGHGIEKLAPGATVYKVLPPSAVQGNGAALPLVRELGVPEAEQESEDEQVAEGNPVPPQESVERVKRKRIQKAIVAVKGVDWDSDMSFRDYSNQKNADNAQERYLVVAGWFKNYRNVSVITPGHIVAAFDVMDWTKPENIPHLFRVIKNTKEWFDKGEKPHEWVLAQRGVNALDRLGKGVSEA